MKAPAKVRGTQPKGLSTEPLGAVGRAHGLGSPQHAIGEGGQRVAGNHEPGGTRRDATLRKY